MTTKDEFDKIIREWVSQNLTITCDVVGGSYGDADYVTVKLMVDDDIGNPRCISSDSFTIS